MNCLQQRFAIQWYLARPCIISGQDARTTRNFGIWYLARPCIISGQDARTTRNFGIFFKLQVSNLKFF
jgi:hypothetical protein